MIVRSFGWAAAGVAALLLTGCSAGSTEAESSAPDAAVDETTAAPETPSDGGGLSGACGAAIDAVASLFLSDGYSVQEVAFPAGWSAAFPADVVEDACAVEVTPDGEPATTWVAFAASEAELDDVFDVSKLEGYEVSGNASISAGVSVLGIPVDLSGHPDPAALAPFELVIMG